MRLGVFGGSFNPIHRCHLEVARAVREAHRLDRVLFVPAGTPPHKESDVAPAHHRLAMVRLAVEGEDGFEASDIEVRREGKSYTVKTLEELKRLEPSAELFFIVGSDTLPEMRTWYEAAKVFALARVVAVERPGYPLEEAVRALEWLGEETRSQVERDGVRVPPCPVSSTQVREAIAQGEPIRDLVPPQVERYIAEHGLYR